MTTRRDFVLGGMATGLSSNLFAQAGNWPENPVKIIGPDACFRSSERIKWKEAVQVSGAKLD